MVDRHCEILIGITKSENDIAQYQGILVLLAVQLANFSI